MPSVDWIFAMLSSDKPPEMCRSPLTQDFTLVVVREKRCFFPPFYGACPYNEFIGPKGARYFIFVVELHGCSLCLVVLTKRPSLVT